MDKRAHLQSIIDKKNSNPAVNELLKGVQMLKGEQGIPGKDGYTPIKGKDYYTEAEINAIIRYIQAGVKDGAKGDKGDTGAQGKPGINGIDAVVDYAKIIKETLKKIPTPKDGKSVDVNEVIKKVQDGMPPVNFKDEIGKILASPGMRMLLHGGGLSSVSHDATLTGDGTISSPLSVVGGGGGMVYPGVGIALSNGSGWDTSITNNSANWDTAYGWGNHASAGYYVGTDSTIRGLISETITGIDYDNTTGVFSLTTGYVIPTTIEETNWNSAYSNMITSLTTTGTSGAATLIAGVLNIPQYSGGGGSPGGSSGSIQYNDGAGNFAGSTTTVTGAGTINVASTQTYNLNSQIMVQADSSLANYYLLRAGNTGNSGAHNLGIGTGSLGTSGSGYYNVIVGDGAMGSANYNGNAILGYIAGSNLLGNYNSAFGYSAAVAIGGSYNSSFGMNSMGHSGNNASYNTAIGSESLGRAAGNRNVALGYFSGAYETGDNSFYVNNIDQTNTTGDKAYSLMYGTFAGTATSLTGQQLTINGKLKLGGYGSGTITGTPTYTLAVDSSGNVIETTGGGGGGGTPGGANTQVQFNDTGAFNGDSKFYWNNTTKVLYLGAENDSGYIYGPDATTSNLAGGQILIKSGLGNGSGQGGPLFLNAGNGGATGTGGQTTIVSGTGGAIGDGGIIEIVSGSGGVTSGQGGLLRLTSGGGGGSGSGGDIQIIAGGNVAVGAPGNIFIHAGDQGITDTNGGNIILEGGAGNGIGLVGQVGIRSLTTNTNGSQAIFDTSLLTTNKNFTFPDLAGTIALTSDIIAQVYPGAGIAVSTGAAWDTSITDNSTDWNTAYANRITSLTTTGSSGASTLIANTLNIPEYTLAGLGGVPTTTTVAGHALSANIDIALDDLSDVIIASPVTDQVLRYNGSNWVNGNTVSVGAGAGVSLFFSNSASGISTYETISQIPDSGAEVDESITVNNNTLAFEAYSTTAALGRTTIDAGIWKFNVYCYATPSTGLTTIAFNVYKRAAGGSETLLFTATTADIDNATVGLVEVSTVQPAYTILDTDILVVKLDASTTSVVNVDLHFVHSGTSHYSNIETPLVTLHNDLAGLQGGTSGEFYHLTSSEYTNLSGRIKRSINVISTPTTAGATQYTDYVYIVSGTTTLTLPTAVGNTNMYTVKNSGSNVVTVDTTSAQTIDGASTLTINTPYAYSMVSNNSNWVII